MQLDSTTCTKLQNEMQQQMPQSKKDHLGELEIIWNDYWRIQAVNLNVDAFSN